MSEIAIINSDEKLVLWRTVCLGMDHDDDFAIWSTPRCGSLVLQLLRSVIPVKLGNGARSIFIAVCVSVVGKEGKVSICSGVDTHGSDALGIRGT